MATTLSIPSISGQVQWTFTDIKDWGNSVNSSVFSYSTYFTDGTGAGKANKIYISYSTIAASGNVTFDLAGSLLDMFGNTITMTKVKVIYFELLNSTSASSVLIGAGTNPMVNWVAAAGDAVRVRNGGFFLLSCSDATGYAVTAGTADVLRILNEDSSNIATYRVVILGEG